MPKSSPVQSDQYRDFDEFWKSSQAIPITFKVKGESFELPPDIPAVAAITAISTITKAGANPDTDMAQGEVFQVMIDILGPEQWDRLLKTRASAKQIEDVFTWIMQQYRLIGDSGNLETPAEPGEESTSSPTGDQ